MIVLTGDVHHMTLKTKDQSFLAGSEAEAALEYARIAREYGIKVTLFSTGKAVREETAVFRMLAKMDNVELGGHNYYCFKPKYLYGASGRFLGLSNGPAFFQAWEIQKTKRLFEQVLGLDICSWRDHGYRHDRNTYRLLAVNGIRVVSDEVGPSYKGPYPVYPRLWSLPVNVLPDHDHLIHGAVGTTSTNARRPLKMRRSSFEEALYPSNEWLDLVHKQAVALVESGKTATLLVHPCCMKILDGFDMFNGLCRFLSNYKSYCVRELWG